MKDKRKLLLLAALLGALVWINWPRSPSPTAAILPLAAKTQRGAGQSAEPAIPDARLQLERLERAGETELPEVSRNVFEYARHAAAGAGGESPPDAAEVAPAPPSPPRSPLRFYGFAESNRDGRRRVFLTDGEEIYVAAEGEVIKKQYRVVRVQNQSVEVEELAGERRWVVPLEQP